MKRAFPAAVLSLLQPGFGHLYLVRLERAAVFFFIHAALALLLFLGFGVATPLALVSWLLVHLVFRVVVVLDSVRIASRSDIDRCPWYSRFPVCLLFLVIAGVALVPALERVQTVKSFRAASVNMEPALRAGDHLVVDLKYFLKHQPDRGRIALAASPERPDLIVIQRIVGLPGDSLRIRNKKLIVNGEPLEEPWVQFHDARTYPYDPSSNLGVRDNLPELRIPDGMVFLMGDSRDRSYDSRWLGPVPVSHLVGSPMYIYWSSEFERIGKSLQGEQ